MVRSRSWGLLLKGSLKGPVLEKSDVKGDGLESYEHSRAISITEPEFLDGKKLFLEELFE